MNYFTVEYGLHTSLPVLAAPLKSTPKAKPQRTLAAVELGHYDNDNAATLAAATKFAATPLRVNILAAGERRWLVLNELEYKSLLEEVA